MSAPGWRLFLTIARTLTALLFVIALPVLMITSAVRFAINEQEVYDYAISTFDGPAETGVPAPELRRASGELINYFNSDEPAANILVEVNGQGEPLFSPREVSHLKDVKTLVGANNLVQEVALAYVMLYVVGVFIWSAESSLRTLASQALTACLVTVGVIGAVGALAASGFDSSWEGFHEIVFSNDLWRLDPDTDRLIQIFPEEFWFRVVMFVGGLVLLQVAIIATAALFYGGVSRRRELRRRVALGV